MLRRLALAVLVLSVLAPASASSARHWAVVIGVDEYQNSSVTDLQFAEADARLFAETLRSTAGFRPEDVFLFTTGQGGEQAPSRTNIAFRFDYLRKNVGPADTLVVYFSGHGVEIEGQSFLLTQEADARSLLTLQQSALHARDLFSWLAASRAGRTLLVVDACRNDPIQGRGAGDNALSQGLARDLALVDLPAEAGSSATPSSATLFACSAGQRSFEWADRGHGFFTYYLVEGLRGGARSADGAVTLASLVSYLQKQVPQATQRWAMREQAPWLRYEGPGADGWVLSRPSGAVVAESSSAAEDARVREAEERARRAEEARLAAEERARRAEETRSTGDLESTRDLLARIGALETGLTGAPTPLWVSHGAGAPFSSVARAVAAAPAGSKVYVRPGVYVERVVLERPVSLVGDGGEVILRSPDSGPAVEVRSAGVVLDSLTVQGGLTGQPTLRNCKVEALP